MRQSLTQSWLDQIELIEHAHILPAQPSEDAVRVTLVGQQRQFPAWLVEENEELGRSKVLFYDDCLDEERTLTVDSWRLVR